MDIKKQKLVEYVDDVLCDICNKSCKYEFNFEFARLSANWGYESKNDGDFYSIDMCEDCFERTIQHLKSVSTNPERLLPTNSFK